MSVFNVLEIGEKIFIINVWKVFFIYDIVLNILK